MAKQPTPFFLMKPPAMFPTLTAKAEEGSSCAGFKQMGRNKGKHNEF
jgi:hypothetical protein